MKGNLFMSTVPHNMSMPKLRINEIFGPTLQGEGPYIGQRAIWVRTALCNQSCGWCDTAYTWAYTAARAARHEDQKVYDVSKEIHELSVMEVRTEVMKLADDCIVVLSGGEPLLQTGGRLVNDPSEPAKGRKAEDLLGELAWTLANTGYRIHVETAGTRLPGYLLNAHVEYYVVSPKLVSSGNTTAMRRVPKVLDFFSELSNVTFKFVVTAEHFEADMKEIDMLVEMFAIRADTVMLMPEGRTPVEVIEGTRRLAQTAIERGYGLSTRLQTVIWGEERRRLWSYNIQARSSCVQSGARGIGKRKCSQTGTVDSRHTPSRMAAASTSRSCSGTTTKYM
jgi:7-carboxy-7-deazaguanine synthase